MASVISMHISEEICQRSLATLFINAKGRILNLPGFLQHCGNFWDLAHLTLGQTFQATAS